MATNNGQWKTGWNETGFHHAAATTLGQIDALVVAAVQNERRFFSDQLAHFCVVCFGTRDARDGKVAGQAHFVF